MLRVEHSRHGDNPRFVVASPATDEIGARALHEDVYCQRSDLESRIKEKQLGLLADRVTAHTSARTM